MNSTQEREEGEEISLARVWRHIERARSFTLIRLLLTRRSAYPGGGLQSELGYLSPYLVHTSFIVQRSETMAGVRVQDGVMFAICCRMRTLLASWWVRLERGVAALNVREGDCA